MHIFMEMCMSLIILLLVNNVASRRKYADATRPPVAGPHRPVPRPHPPVPGQKPLITRPLPPVPGPLPPALRQKPWPLPPVLLPPIPAGLEPVEKRTGPKEVTNTRGKGGLGDKKDETRDRMHGRKSKRIEKMKHDREIDWRNFMAMKGGHWEKINHAKRMDWDKCMKGKRNDWEIIQRDKGMDWEYFKKDCGEKCDEMMHKRGKHGRHGRRMGWEHIVAIVCGGVFVLAVIIVIAIFCAKSKKKNSVSDEKCAMPPAHIPELVLKTDISNVPQYTIFQNEE